MDVADSTAAQFRLLLRHLPQDEIPDVDAPLGAPDSPLAMRLVMGKLYVNVRATGYFYALLGREDGSQAACRMRLVGDVWEFTAFQNRFAVWSGNSPEGPDGNPMMN